MPARRDPNEVERRRPRAGASLLVAASLVLLPARATATQPAPPAASGEVCDPKSFQEPGWRLLCEGYQAFREGVEAEVSAQGAASRRYADALAKYQGAIELFGRTRKKQKTHANTLGLLLALVSRDQAEKKIRGPAFTVPDELLDEEMLLVHELQENFSLDLPHRALMQLGTSVKHIEDNAKGGIVKIKVSANVDGVIAVDDKPRGVIDHRRPRLFWLRGQTHKVTVNRRGFHEAAAVVDENHRATEINLELRPKDAALLVVHVPGGVPADVLLDGAFFGRTSASGSLAIPIGPGTHVVSAHEGDRVSMPASIEVKAGDEVAKALDLEPAGYDVEIGAEPSNATIVVDDVILGRKSWAGTLPTGKHTIKITADGYRDRLWLVPGAGRGRIAESFKLAVDKPWIAPGLLFLEVGGGYLGGFSFGGLDAGGASSGCSISHNDPLIRGAVGSARLELAPGAVSKFPKGLGLGIEAGYLGAWKSVERRLVCPGVAPAKYTVRDNLVFKGPFVGATASYRLPLHPQLAAVVRVMGGLMVPAFSTDAVQATATARADSAAARVEGTSQVLRSFPFLFRPELGAELIARSDVRVRFGLGLEIFGGPHPAFSHREIGVANPRACARPADAACVRSSSALQNEPAYGTFVLLSPQLTFVWAPP